jgi:hypothetical protein
MTDRPTPASPGTADLPDHIAAMFPPPAPVPVGGCTTCTRYAAARKENRAAGDFSAASDASVLLRHHLAAEH